MKKIDLRLLAVAIILSGVSLVLGPATLAAPALIIGILAVMASKRMFNNYYSPLALMSYGWMLPSFFVVFLPYNYKFDGWEIRGELWAAVFFSFFSFGAGHLCYWLFFQTADQRDSYLQFGGSLNRGVVDLQREGHTYEIVIPFFFVVGMIGFALNLKNVMDEGGLSLYWELGFRDVETIFGKSTIVNYLYFCNPLVVIMATAYRRRFGKNNNINTFRAISFIALFFHGIKSTIVFPLVISFIVFLLLSEHIRMKMFLSFLVFILIGFQAVTIGRNVKELQGKDLPEILTYRMFDIYLYFTPAYANIQEEMINFKRFTGGKESFQAFDELAQFISGTRESNKDAGEMSEPFNLVNDAYNVGTYLRELYRDFGYAGIILFPFIYGFITTLFYCNYLSTPSIRNLVIYSIMGMMIVISFFSNHYLKIQYYFWMVLVSSADFISNLFARSRPISDATQQADSHG